MSYAELKGMVKSCYTELICYEIIKIHRSSINIRCRRIQVSHSVAITEISGLMFLRGTWTEKKNKKQTDVPLKKLRNTLHKKRSNNETTGEAQLMKWTREEEQSSPKANVKHRKEKATWCIQHAWLWDVQVRRWFGWLGGALLYLFRVGLLPLK